MSSRFELLSGTGIRCSDNRLSSPCIFMIHITSEEHQTLLSRFLQSHSFPESVQIYVSLSEQFCYSATHFPINRLRNYAIQHVRTSHFVVLDMDLHFSYDIYAQLQRADPSLWAQERSVVILPVVFLTERAVNTAVCRDTEYCVLM